MTFLTREFFDAKKVDSFYPFVEVGWQCSALDSSNAHFVGFADPFRDQGRLAALPHSAFAQSFRLLDLSWLVIMYQLQMYIYARQQQGKCM